MSTPRARKQVTFSFPRCPEARRVTLVGDFNKWDENAHPMTYDPVAGTWTITIELERGRYEYDYLVNERDWWVDPNAPAVPNPWGGVNSLIVVE